MVIQSLGSGPYPTLGDCIDGLRRKPTGSGRALNEVLVEMIHTALQDLGEARIQGAQQIVGIAQPGRGDPPPV